MPDNTIDTLAIDLKYVKGDVEEVKQDVKELDKKVTTAYLTIKSFEEQFIPVKDNFLSKDLFYAEFKPVRNIIYGMVGLILTIVVSAIIYIAMRGGH